MSDGNRINLGDEVKDKISGFMGIAIAVTKWINGCIRVTVSPTDLDKDGKVRENQSFDEETVVVTKAAKVKIIPAPAPQPISVPKAKTGGPKPEARRSSDPLRSR